MQIDTISVVERAHHHVLWSRDESYQPSALNELCRTRKVLEYWSHAASFLPMDQYPQTLVIKKLYQEGKKHWFQKDAAIMKQVLNEIKKRGPLRARDFEKPKRKGQGWWEWAPPKKALEQLFMQGRLVASHREGFQKVYDLPERVIPKTVFCEGKSKIPTTNEWAKNLITQTLRSQGLASLKEIAYLRSKTVRGWVAEALNEMEAQGSIVPITFKNETSFALTQELTKFLDTSPKRQEPGAPRLSILSPFDPLVIQRARLKRFFDFDYSLALFLRWNP